MQEQHVLLVCYNCCCYCLFQFCCCCSLDREMAHQKKVLAAMLDDLTLIPGPTGEERIDSHMCIVTHMCACTHIHISKWVCYCVS